MTTVKTEATEFTEEILGHNVRWWVESDDVEMLSETDTEHIRDMIEQGYTQGQLCLSFEGDSGYEETTGWWLYMGLFPISRHASA